MTSRIRLKWRYREETLTLISVLNSGSFTVRCFLGKTRVYWRIQETILKLLFEVRLTNPHYQATDVKATVVIVHFRVCWTKLTTVTKSASSSKNIVRRRSFKTTEMD